MTSSDDNSSDRKLEELSATLAELRKAVRTRDPLLREVASSSLYPALALAMGLLLFFVCIAMHKIAADTRTPNQAALLWVLVGAILVAGGTVKLVLSRRLATSYDPQGFSRLMSVVYGGKVASSLLIVVIVLCVGIAFLIKSGIPAYIVPLVAIIVAIAAQGLDQLIDLPEYRIMSWSSLALGSVSLFFVESSPWLWSAIVFGGIFMIFGASGLVRRMARHP